MLAIPTPPSGLTQAEAMRRLAEAGPNRLYATRSRTLLAIVGGALREPMFLLLLAASATYLLLGDLGEGLFLTAGACVAVGLVVLQEARSERALSRLQALAEPMARVMRDGAVQTIPAQHIVVGDILLVGEGERIAADGILRGSGVVTVDESTLTGESVPVAKTPGQDLLARETAAPQGEDASASACIFAGALVVGGQGSAQVIRTGADTALGRIGRQLASLGEQATPLQRRAAVIVGWLGAAAVVFCLLIVVLHGVLRGDWLGGVLSGLTVGIALIPEEFPMVLAVFLALGAWRLARRNVLVRRAAVVEALGGATMLCVDKTGTLTENDMRLRRVWTDGTGEDAPPDGDLSPKAAFVLQLAAMASPDASSDPLDRAVHRLSRPRAEPPQRTWPLDVKRLAVVQLWADVGGNSLAAKGAPEAIFRLCRLTEGQIAKLHEAAEGMAQEGLRVLGVAGARSSGLVDSPEDVTFDFAGFVAFEDPVRPEVPAALAEARGAGISVCMITGDYPATALAIARRAGIDTRQGVLTGSELAAMDPASIQDRIAGVRVFARIQPEQKLALVEAFKSAGEVVAMTGDGVNDAPALEAAQIGIAMGRRGTDVAREAADLVLLDDRFDSIVGGVRLGRRVFANLRRALTYVTAIHLPIAGLALAPILAGLPPLLLPMHVVVLEMAVDPLCSLVFEAEPGERDAMRQPPRPPKEALFGPAQVGWAALQGLTLFGATFGFYVWASANYPVEVARGVAVGALLIGNLTLALSDTSAPSSGLFAGPRVAFWSVCLAALSALAALLFIPAISRIFHVSAPPGPLLAAAGFVGLLGGGFYGFLTAVRSQLRRRAWLEGFVS